ncbi:protein containing Prepilin-type cleavage/methylation, partial [gut metagenome]
MKPNAGFTLIELVLVLLLIGIISIFVTPKVVPMVVSTSQLEEAKLEVIARIVHARNRALLLAPGVKPTLSCQGKNLSYQEKKSITI